MSDKENARKNNFTHEKVFFELIDAAETRDSGIVSFEQTMLEAEERLASKFIGKKGSINDKLRDEEEKLNGSWEYNEEIATVSGRVYLMDSAEAGSVPDSWGEPITDDEDRVYYFVNDVKFVSHGVDLMTVLDESGVTIEIKLGYSFATVDDDDVEEDDPIYVSAYPGELSKHQYELPTAIEAQVRLERLWPEEFKFMQSLLRPGLQSALPRRLTLFANRFQKQLAESTQFCELANLYLDEALALDETTPYALTINSTFEAFDGKNPYDPDDKGDWIIFNINESFTILAYSPGVHFSTDKETGVISVSILFKTYNTQDGDEPEFLSIDSYNISQFQSTRNLRSVTERALIGMGMAAATNDIAVSNYFPAEDVEVSDDAIRADSVKYKESIRSTEPLHIQEMKLLESELQKVIKEIKAHQKIVYPDLEDARQACVNLLQDSVSELLVQAGLANDYLFEFSGPGIRRPKAMQGLPDVSNKPHIAVFGIDSEDPLKSLDNGDSFQGIVKMLRPSTKYVYDSEGKTIGYIACPILIVQLSLETKTLLTWEDVSLANANFDTKAIIPLDGSVEMKMSVLEEYKNNAVALQAVKKQYGASPIVSHLEQMNSALHSETQAFQLLKKVKILSQLASDIKEIAAQEKSVSPALNLIEAMLINRKVRVMGEIYSNKNGQLVLEENEDNPRELTNGVIVDIRNEQPDNELILTVQVALDEVRHIPVKTITDFMF